MAEMSQAAVMNAFGSNLYFIFKVQVCWEETTLNMIKLKFHKAVINILILLLIH